MYKFARKSVNMSREVAAERLNISTRSLSSYENGETFPPAHVVIKMAKLYKMPVLTQLYCKECAIGKFYGYEVLNNINTDPVTVTIKLEEEMTEANEVLKDLFKVLVNKNTRNDFSDKEHKELLRAYHELLDLEHTIEILKTSLEGKGWIDNSEEIQKHNKKCIMKKFHIEQKEKSPLELALLRGFYQPAF
ncbi:helix-turn-helix domain-containing protein [Tepidibacter formicigenes]|jgi:transcriptional regulator with XRE-family HTH domain|uniref:Helix-turn-helix domain-containing protein n=1 Tax=Tepidibacter formicigenes DSM 15518 TaxID=1123349 RepID=A0A1M6SMW9_9FIRM|nr:helix-turn-helix transcriptional regulator [Tepidibacter formicigenes]SHK45938.1 Helix-turn-helix domain-containing protein [Tepidibacter formicigenes DSM 15518]